VREGGFCVILIGTARKSLISNGEMSEWLKEHAWKLIPCRAAAPQISDRRDECSLDHRYLHRRRYPILASCLHRPSFGGGQFYCRVGVHITVALQLFMSVAARTDCEAGFSAPGSAD
jgi:hypothetical protein